MKQCQAPNCNNPVFSHHYCKMHQNLRTDEKWLSHQTPYIKNHKLSGHAYDTSSQIKFGNRMRKSFAGYNEHGRIKQKPKEVTGEKELFEELWSTREHKSWLTGASLKPYEEKMDEEQCWHKHPLWVNLFHHVLNKKNYSWFRLLHDNIIVILPQEHLDLHSLSMDKLIIKYGKENMKRYYQLVQTLKERYNHE